jgi:hypothetical protein
MTYDNRHGGPYDRGGADYFYGRPFEPHYFVGATYTSDKVELADMTPDEITAYSAGYRDAEERGNQKDWGDAS